MDLLSSTGLGDGTVVFELQVINALTTGSKVSEQEGWKNEDVEE